MDDTRHVASWIGGQEALHDRVLTLDEALAAVEAVDAAAVQRAGRPSCSATTACGWRPSPRRATCAASSRACGCRHDGAGRRSAAPAGRRRARRRPTWSLARRAPPARARWRSPGPSSRRWPAPAASTAPGRSTSPRRAGGPATWPVPARPPGRPWPAGDEPRRAGRSRPRRPPRWAARARRAGWRAGRWTRAGGPIDAIFAGMPRSAVWPADAGRAAADRGRPCSSRTERRRGRGRPGDSDAVVAATLRAPAGDDRGRGRPSADAARRPASGTPTEPDVEPVRAELAGDPRRASRRAARRRPRAIAAGDLDEPPLRFGAGRAARAVRSRPAVLEATERRRPATRASSSSAATRSGVGRARDREARPRPYGAAMAAPAGSRGPPAGREPRPIDRRSAPTAPASDTIPRVQRDPYPR